MTSFAEQSGGESPIHDELAVAPKGHQEWLNDVVTYESQRDLFIAHHEQSGTDPHSDLDFKYLLGKLEVAQDQLRAHAGQQLSRLATEVAVEASKPQS